MSSTKPFLCFDLGGTNLRAALINREGEILSQSRVSVIGARGFKDLLRLFTEVVEPWRVGGQDWELVSVASAGPLDPVEGVLLDPTNFLTDSKGWGVLPLVKELEALYKKKVFLENDAAAALLAETWKGAAVGKKNVTLMTLGTGVGTAFLVNGDLVRSGRNLHTEASHIPINAYDTESPCACGGYGCVEAYLAGSHFAKRIVKLLNRPGITGEEAAELAREGDSKVRAAFDKYAEHLALAVRAYAMTFSSEVVVLGGGFSSNADCFIDQANQKLPALFERHRDGVDMLPKLVISPIHDVAGLLGAARVAMVSE